MNLKSIVSNLIKPVTSLIDEIFTTDEERAKAKIKLQSIKNSLAVTIIGYENQLLRQKSAIIQAEANGQSWLQRNWRPITMLTFLILIICDSFGLLVFRLSADAWTLLKIGLGGYVVGRSGEKIVQIYKKEK